MRLEEEIHKPVRFDQPFLFVKKLFRNSLLTFTLPLKSE